MPGLGGSRSQAQRTAWAPERAGDRRGGDPGRLPQLLSRGSVNWLGRPAAPRSYRLARGHRHAPTPGTGARVYTHTHKHTRTHSHKASAAGKRDAGAPLAAEGPGGRRLCAQRVPSARAAPAPLPAPAAASRPAPAAPRLASGCAVNPRSPAPRPAEPGPPPALGRRPERAAHPAGVPSAAGGRGRAQQRGDFGRPTPGRARRGTGASRLGEGPPPLRPECSGFGALAGARGGAPGRRPGHASAPTPAAFFLRLLLSAGST